MGIVSIRSGIKAIINPLRYWLFQYFNLLPEDDAAIRLQKFSHKLDNIVNDTEIEDLKKN